MQGGRRAVRRPFPFPSEEWPMKTSSWVGLLVALMTALACGRSERPSQTAAAADTAKPWRKPGDQIDSILPMPEYLRRFRQGMTEPVRLEGGATSREGLARLFLAALAARDSAAIGRLLISRAEFAWLVFPQHIYSEPPYELDPRIFWMQLGAESTKGFQRVLQQLGSHVLGFRDLRCQRDTLQLRPGPAALWSSCRVSYRNGTKVETHRLFGSMVERDGRVKLLTVSNDF
jgi:hypothetical protein